MLAKTPIGNRFYSWVNSQDPDRRYQWSDNCNCACSRFLQEELGLSQSQASDAFHAALFPIFSDRHGSEEAKEIWLRFNGIAYHGGEITAKSWTFGALAERIRAKHPEFV